MRILGVDYGSVRVGLAISEESGVLAMPMETVSQPMAIARIGNIVSEKKIQMIVVGLPRNMNGSYGPKAEEVHRFIQSLAKTVTIEIRPWDERLTTQGVERMLTGAGVSRKQRKMVVDKLAAQQILQSYLDAHSSNEEPVL